jgi:hypothetical protein
MRNYSELQYHADVTESLEIIQKWRKQSDKEELIKLSNAILGISIYVANLQNERKAFDRIVDELKSDKWRAIKRAQKAEKL